MKDVTLARTYAPDRTTGVLRYLDNDGNIITHQTLEPPRSPDSRGIACIPELRTAVKWGWMAAHKVSHYELQDVPGHTGIFMHKGVFVTDSLGCILMLPLQLAVFEKNMAKQDFMLSIVEAK